MNNDRVTEQQKTKQTEIGVRVYMLHQRQAMAKFKFSRQTACTTVFRVAIIQNRDDFIYRHLKVLPKLEFFLINGQRIQFLQMRFEDFCDTFKMD